MSKREAGSAETIEATSDVVEDTRGVSPMVNVIEGNPLAGAGMG